MKEIAAEKIRNAFEDLIRDKKALVKLLSILLILLLAAVLKIHGSNNAKVTVEDAESAGTETAEEASDESSDEACADEEQILFVDISGAVEKPGVYQVAAGTRLFEVVGMAGGLTDKADHNSINQASFVEDGEKIIIPSAGEAGAASADGNAAAASVTSGSGGASSFDPSMTLININIASKEELTTLNGIGDVIAERIIEYRSSNKFKSKEDIKSVKGIGDGIYDKIKDDITC